MLTHCRFGWSVFCCLFSRFRLLKSLLLLLLALTRGSLSLPLASRVDAAFVNAAAIVAARVSPARLRDMFIPPLPSSAPLTRRSVAFLSAKKSARTTKQQEYQHTMAKHNRVFYNIVVKR
jgi:hypothetical protein